MAAVSSITFNICLFSSKSNEITFCLLVYKLALLFQQEGKIPRNHLCIFHTI